MSSATATIPNHFKGNPGDCLAVIMQASQWKMNPYSVAQKTHLIKGILGYEAQLVSAVINSSGVIKDRFNFEWFGQWEKVVGKFTIKARDNGQYRVPGWDLNSEEGLGVKIWATLKGENKPRELNVLLSQARTRNSTLWADDPKQQLAYLAQKKWARLFAPDVIMGVYTKDEIIEGDFEVIDVDSFSKGTQTIHIEKSEQPDYSEQILEISKNIEKQNTVKDLNTYFETIDPALIGKVKHLFTEQKNKIIASKGDQEESSDASQ